MSVSIVGDRLTLRNVGVLFRAGAVYEQFACKHSCGRQRLDRRQFVDLWLVTAVIQNVVLRARDINHNILMDLWGSIAVNFITEL
jgi:hypothetical protein